MQHMPLSDVTSLTCTLLHVLRRCFLQTALRTAVSSSKRFRVERTKEHCSEGLHKFSADPNAIKNLGAYVACYASKENKS